jgi:hypothetical protein
LGDIVILDNHELQVQEMDGRRVSRVWVFTREVPQEEEADVD